MQTTRKNALFEINHTDSRKNCHHGGSAERYMAMQINDKTVHAANSISNNYSPELLNMFFLENCPFDTRRA